MITVWLITVLFFIAIVGHIWWDDFGGPETLLGWIGSIFITALVTTLGWLAGKGIGLLVAILIPQHWVEVSNAELVNLRDADGIEGSFFLGSGHVDTTPYYFCYYKTKDGGFVPYRVEVGQNVKIFEEDRQDATLVSYQEVFQSKGWEWLAVDYRKDRYEFHIPGGTIKRGYNLK